MTTQPAQRSIPLPVTLILLLTVAVSVGIFMKSKEYTQIVPSFPETAEATTTMQSTFTALQAASWHYTQLAERDIQELGEGQRVMNGIVVDPQNGAIAYFSTSSFDAKQQEMTLSVYRYDMQILSYTRLYRAVYREGQSRHLPKDTWPVWHVIGYDNERIVLLLEDVNLATVSCDVPLLVGIDTPSSATLLTLSLDDPSTGLSAYIPQEEDVAAARETLHACTSK